MRFISRKTLDFNQNLNWFMEKPCCEKMRNFFRFGNQIKFWKVPPQYIYVDSIDSGFNEPNIFGLLNQRKTHWVSPSLNFILTLLYLFEVRQYFDSEDLRNLYMTNNFQLYLVEKHFLLENSAFNVYSFMNPVDMNDTQGEFRYHLTDCLGWT